MAFKLRDVIKKSKGGMIGVTVGGKQQWFDEGDFMEMFEKEGTKEVLVDAIKHGRSPEKKKAEEIPDLKPRADISSPNKWDESEPEQVFDENIAEEIPPKPVEEPVEEPASKAPMDEIERRAKPSPYGREEEVEAITPQNFPVFEKRSREMLNNKLQAFDFLKKLHPKDIVKRKIAESEEKWFDEFAQSNSPRGGLQHELMDDYKKDKDPDMRRFVYAWQRELTLKKEATYDDVNNKYFAAQQQRDKLRIHVENQLDAKREEMNEIVKTQKEAKKEEAKKHTPENRVKDMKAILKAKRSLADAEREQDKEAIATYKAELKLLEDRLRMTTAGKDPWTSEQKDAQRMTLEQRQLEKLMTKYKLSPEQAAAKLKEYNAGE